MNNENISSTEALAHDNVIADLALPECDSVEVDPEIIAALDAQVERIRAGKSKLYDWHEVAAWMDSWFTDNELPEPQCRQTCAGYNQKAYITP